MMSKQKHRSGFVSIVGNPNVGKSTLMNAFVGERLSIITSKAQTTRHRILGILNGEDFQVILSDTPGVIKPAYELQEHMMGFVKSAIDDADVLIYLIELGEKDLKDADVLEKINNTDTPVLLLINKIDLGDTEQLEAAVEHWTEKVPKADVFAISALRKIGRASCRERVEVEGG